MSQASASRTIKYLMKSGTYTAIVNAPSGDIRQYWSGVESNITAVRPRLDLTQPVLELFVTSSRVAENDSNGMARPYAVEIYIGTTKALWYDGSSQQTSYDGLLELVVPKFINPGAQGASLAPDCWQVRIKDNFTSHGFTAPVTIRFAASVSWQGVEDQVEALYNVKIGQDTGSTPLSVAICADDDLHFTIREKGQSVAVRAEVREYGEPVANSATAYDYDWYIAEAVLENGAYRTGWSSHGSGAQQSFAEAEIQTSAEIMVKAKDKSTGDVVAVDFQTLTDATDPYVINPKAVPADETIEEGNPLRQKVTYTPELVSRSTGTPAVPQPTFLFILTDAEGNYLNEATRNTPMTTFDVTAAAAYQGGDMSLVIIAND